jgi:hypothetical protein
MYNTLLNNDDVDNKAVKSSNSIALVVAIKM